MICYNHEHICDKITGYYNAATGIQPYMQTYTQTHTQPYMHHICIMYAMQRTCNIYATNLYGCNMDRAYEQHHIYDVHAARGATCHMPACCFGELPCYRVGRQWSIAPLHCSRLQPGMQHTCSMHATSIHDTYTIHWQPLLWWAQVFGPWRYSKVCIGWAIWLANAFPTQRGPSGR